MDTLTLLVVVVLCAILLQLLYGSVFGRSRVVVIADHASDHVREMVESCPSLWESYVPNPLIMNGHMMAVVATLMHKHMRVELEREVLLLSDRGKIAVDWAQHENIRPRNDSSAPILVALHGLVGHSKTNYMQHLLERIADSPRSFRCCVMNARGCGEMNLETPQGFTAGHTNDVRELVNSLVTRFPGVRILLVGFSLGANILVKYLGEEGDACPAAAAISISNPFDLQETDRHMLTGLVTKYVYNRGMTATLQRWFATHADSFADELDQEGREKVLKARTVREFDEAYVVPVYKYKDVDEYYRTSSSVHGLARVSVPLLCLNALDDPICPPSSLPPEQVLKQSKNVVQVVTERGSHVAWLEGKNPFRRRSWADSVVCEFATAVLGSPSRDSDTHTASRDT